MNDPRVQAVFKRFGHNNLSIFINNQEYYELAKKLFELMEKTFTSSNQTFSVMYIFLSRQSKHGHDA